MSRTRKYTPAKATVIGRRRKLKLTEDKIRIRAHQIYQETGNDDADTNWLKAKSELESI